MREINGVNVHFKQCDTHDEPDPNFKQKMNDVFAIKSWPTILVFAPKSKTYYVYEGDRTMSKIVQFAEKVAKHDTGEDVQEGLVVYRVPRSLMRTVNHNGNCLGV